MIRLIVMRLIIMLAVMVILAPVVNAEPSSAVAFDLPTLRMLKSADPANGEALAGKSKCSKCHGENGEGLQDKQAPKISGQYDWYIISSILQDTSNTQPS